MAHLSGVWSTRVREEADDPLGDLLALLLLQEVPHAGDDLRRAGAGDPRRRGARLQAGEKIGAESENSTSARLPALERRPNLEHRRRVRMLGLRRHLLGNATIPALASGTGKGAS